MTLETEGRMRKSDEPWLTDENLVLWKRNGLVPACSKRSCTLPAASHAMVHNFTNETSLLGTGRGVTDDVFRIGCQRKTPLGLPVYVDVPTASRSSSRSYSTARAAPSPYSSSGVQRTQSAPPPTTAQGQAPGLLGSIAGMVGQGKMHDLQPGCTQACFVLDEYRNW